METQKDVLLNEVAEYQHKVWPHGKYLSQEITRYKKVRKSLQYKDSPLFKDQKIVDPAPMRKAILAEAHSGHPGTVRRKRQLRECNWWLGIDAQVESLVNFCHGCQQSAKSHPSIAIQPTDIPAPTKPAVQYAIDIWGDFNGREVVVLLDCFAYYPESLDMADTTSRAIITLLKDVFAPRNRLRQRATICVSGVRGILEG